VNTNEIGNTANKLSSGINKAMTAANILRSFVSSVSIIIFLVFVLCMVQTVMSSGITRSTKVRQPLDTATPFNQDCIVDTINCVEDPDAVISALGYFYEHTGIQPYLYAASDVNGNTHVTEKDMSEFEREVYEALATDNQSVVLLYMEWNPGDVTAYLAAGADAESVLDEEALRIMSDYCKRLYAGSSTHTEYFADVFTKSTDRMLTVTADYSKYFSIAVIVIIGLVTLAFVASILRNRTKIVVTSDPNAYTPPDDATVMENKYPYLDL